MKNATEDSDIALLFGYSLITVLPIILMIVIPVGILAVIIVLLRIGSPFKDNVGAITILIIVLEIEIPFTNIKKGDLIFFPGHVVMYLGDGEYVHSSTSNDVWE